MTDGAKRGPITSWSEDSRRRLRRALARLDRRRLGESALEMTLTYPGDWQAWCSTGKQAKRDLRAFVERWARNYGERPNAVWKLEFQRRGAPHFMLLLKPPQGRTLDDVREFTARSWAEIVTGGSDAKHARAGTEVSQVRDFDRIISYMAGYLTKRKGHQETPPAGFDTGRWWNVPTELMHPSYSIELEPGQATKARRWIRRGIRSHSKTKRKTRAQDLITSGSALTLAVRIAAFTQEPQEG
jgi:hypothetical protein